MDRGAIALQVNEGNAKLVHLPDPPASESVSVHKVDATLAPDGSAQLDWRAEVSGVEASEWRVRFHADATRKQRVQQMIASHPPGQRGDGVDADNLEDVEQNVSLRVHGKAPQFARAEGDALMVPMGRKEHMVRDYAPLSSRKLDVRLYAQWTQVDDWTVHLPPGAKVKGAPPASQGSSPFGTYEVAVESSAATLHVKTTVTLAKTRIAASEYPAFRAWCEQVDRALGQRATVSRQMRASVTVPRRGVDSPGWRWPPRRWRASARAGVPRRGPWRPRPSPTCGPTRAPRATAKRWDAGRWRRCSRRAARREQAAAARQRLDAVPHQGMWASLARATVDEVHGDPRVRGGGLPRGAAAPPWPAATSAHRSSAGSRSVTCSGCARR